LSGIDVSGYRRNDLSTFRNRFVTYSPILHGCTIEDGALIGMGSIVMNGARIGRGSIVGAGSVITKANSFPSTR
jgi:carbonic anhydrase/acetyltransferase-like protein (isoleucine patch superfamily)